VITDVPTSEFHRNSSRKPEVRGEKPLKPIIDMLLAATNNAVTKSRGVGPLSAVMSEPRKGWKISAAPRLNTTAQKKTRDNTTAGPHNDSTSAPRRPNARATTRKRRHVPRVTNGLRIPVPARA
jgi:hypothetical protein